jgi:hypothetical protein
MPQIIIVGGGGSGTATQIHETGGPTDLDIAAIPDGTFLQRSGTDVVGATPAGAGDVTGPGSSTDRSIVTWNGATGTVLRTQAAPTIDASGNIVMGGAATVDGVDVSGHAARHNAGGADAMAIDAVAATGSLRTLGTSATSACAGNDTRLPTQAANDALAGTSGAPSGANPFVTDADARNTNARTPTAHAASHRAGGSDPVEAGIVRETSGPTNLTVGAIADGEFPRRSGATIVGAAFGSSAGTITEGNDTRLSDARTPTAHAVSHRAGGSDPVEAGIVRETSGPTNLVVGAIADGSFARRSGATLVGAAFGTSAGTVTEGNDARIPTQAENDALAGTSGAPSSTNAFVTDADPRNYSIHPPVRAATAAALPAYTRTTNVITASANGALAAVDGVTLVVNDRLLLKNGAAGADNGIYTVTTVGDGSNPYVLTRASDMNASADVLPSCLVMVQEGTTQADTCWQLTTNAAITLNTTALTYAQFGAGGGGGTPGGSSGQVQYNNASAFDGAANVLIDADERLSTPAQRHTVAAAPSTPAADSGFFVYGDRMAGLDRPILLTEDGFTFPLDLGFNGIPLLVVPNSPNTAGGAVPVTGSGGIVRGAQAGSPNAGGITYPAPTFNGTIITRHNRFVGASGTAAGNSGGLFLVGTAGGFEAFFSAGAGFAIEWDIASGGTHADGTRSAYGITSELAAQDPDDLDDCLFLGRTDGDTDDYWHILHKNASAAVTNISLDGTITRPAYLGGGTFPAADYTTARRWRFRIVKLPDVARYSIRVQEVTTSGPVTVYEANLTSNIPRETVGMFIINDRSTGTTSGTAVESIIYRISGYIGLD